MKQERKDVFVNSDCFSFNVYNFLSLQLQNIVLL